MYYNWILFDKLAVSPLPSLKDVEELSQIFDGVVILVEPYEVHGLINEYLEKWRRHGVETYYAPTPDYHPIDLLELYLISRWIDHMIERDKKVLVHCMGGIGRSGLTVSAYLLYSGWNIVDTYQYIRSKIPGSLDNLGQRRMFDDYNVFLENIDREIFNELLKHISREYSRHVSKKIQLLIEFSEPLDTVSLDEIIITIPLQYVSNKDMVKKYSDKVLSILNNYRRGESATLEGLLLKIIDILVNKYGSSIVITQYVRFGNELSYIIYCDDECNDLLGTLEPYIKQFSKMTGYKIVLENRFYPNYL